MNNIVKLAVDWKPQCTMDLIEKIFSVTGLQIYFNIYTCMYSRVNASSNCQRTAEGIRKKSDSKSLTIKKKEEIVPTGSRLVVAHHQSL